MAVMKYRVNGEWQPLVATVNADTGLFRYAFVPKTANTYDLSPYVTGDFMLVFRATENASDSSVPLYFWIKSDGKLRLVDNALVNYLNMSKTNSLNDWMPAITNKNTSTDEFIECSYDETTKIFSLPSKVGDYALLFYA